VSIKAISAILHFIAVTSSLAVGAEVIQIEVQAIRSAALVVCGNRIILAFHFPHVEVLAILASAHLDGINGGGIVQRLKVNKIKTMILRYLFQRIQITKPHIIHRPFSVFRSCKNLCHALCSSPTGGACNSTYYVFSTTQSGGNFYIEQQRSRFPHFGFP
jgi:hypothetical protein